MLVHHVAEGLSFGGEDARRYSAVGGISLVREATQRRYSYIELQRFGQF